MLCRRDEQIKFVFEKKNGVHESKLNTTKIYKPIYFFSLLEK